MWRIVFFYSAVFVFCCRGEVPEVVGPVLPVGDATPVVSKSKYNYWQKKAILDFVAIEKKLKKYHAGAADGESHLFRSWLAQGKKDFNERLCLISTQPGWRFALKAYVNGFHDIHVRVRTSFEKKDEWPGFLLEFDGAQFLVAESRIKSVPKGSVVTKIDDVDVRVWIEKNILPYSTDVLETTARYVDAAIFALVWENNPFIAKPKTICFFPKKTSVDEIEEKVELVWRSLSPASFSKKFQKIKAYSPLLDVLNPLRIKDLTPAVTWIKIATFFPETLWAQLMFNRDAQKLAKRGKKETLVFDLRGNGGGLLDNAIAVLAYLYGVDAFSEAEKKATPFLVLM